jgi:enoyl-CoA hydratase/carnithine racemase
MPWSACNTAPYLLSQPCMVRWWAAVWSWPALPEGTRGIFVGGGGSVRIPRLIGVARMTDMMLTGRVYNAADGERVGLAQYLEPKGTSFAKAMELAKRIGNNAPLTNYALINVLPRIAEQPADQGFITESMISAIAQSAPEAKQRVRDFLEGRAAKVQQA